MLDSRRGLGRGYLVLGGQRVPVNVPVNHSLVFAPGMPGTRVRTQPVQFGVMHWSGGDNDASDVYDTLTARGLSIHFILDRAGTIWQCADPARVVCAHVGSGPNAISWGVEIVNYGAAQTPPEAGRERERYEALIRGRWRTVADFLPAQYIAIGALFDAVQTALRLPKAVHHGTEIVPWAELRRFRGVIGHFHVSDDKRDPGTRPLERLAQHWGQQYRAAGG